MICQPTPLWISIGERILAWFAHQTPPIAMAETPRSLPSCDPRTLIKQLANEARYTAATGPGPAHLQRPPEAALGRALASKCLDETKQSSARTHFPIPPTPHARTCLACQSVSN
ncbi:hypothetical protein BC567DRAFT_238748 [Phyllosticta citribraziliensis]